MSILIKILIVVAILLIGLVVFIARRPDQFRVSRSALMAAPPQVVFAQVNDLHKWQQFSPWAKLDPNAQVTFSGPLAGEGAMFLWKGNKEIGEGSMTVIASQSPALVRFRLVFIKPFVGTSTAEFSLVPTDSGTEVSWAMYGENNFMAKAVGLFIDCEKMVGAQFDEGLANLKAIVEADTTGLPSR